VVVKVPAVSDGGGAAVECVADLRSVIADLDSGRLAAAGIDVPIGLPPSGPRQCDVEARRLIGPRRSSVFPAPARGVLGATNYTDALERSRTVSGKGISKQAFNILVKIASVDAVMSPERQRHLVEAHPEVCFRILARGPLSYGKRTPEGRAERLKALRGPFPDVDNVSVDRPPGTGPDDVLDAFVAAWTARRWLANDFVRLGGDLDERGLRMEMIA